MEKPKRLGVRWRPAAEIIGVSYRTIRRRVAEGKLKSVNVLGVEIIPTSEFERLGVATKEAAD
jgi:hypothetical protein